MLGAGRHPIFKVPTSWMGLPFGTKEHKSCIQTLPGPLNPCLPILPGNSLALPTRPGWSSDSTTTIFSQVPRQEALERVLPLATDGQLINFSLTGPCQPQCLHHSLSLTLLLSSLLLSLSPFCLFDTAKIFSPSKLYPLPGVFSPCASPG